MKHRKQLKQSLKDWWEDYRAAVYISSAILGVAMAVTWAGRADEKRQNRIDDQVKEYEKTLPGYLEQKQQVEHFRDSLIHAKNR